MCYNFYKYKKGKKMLYRLQKGSIIIAFIFVIMLSVTAASFFFMLGGRTPLTMNQLKRAQAINCAEAAIYEAFNRIRAGQFTPQNWGTQTVNIPVDDSATTGTYNVPVTVMINAAGAPYAVDATVDYSAIKM